MTILLGGGGSADDERPVLDRFVALTGSAPVAYWPIALRLDDYTKATAYATTALGRAVDTWRRLNDHTPADVDAQAGIFIGGGNTYHLLHEVRAARLAEALSRLAATGVVYGGSAGALILGADIGIAGTFDTNDVGLTDTTGLRLLGEHAVWCHFVGDHVAHLHEWIVRSGRPVIALTERAGGEVSGGVLTSIGREPLLVFDVDTSRSELAPDESRAL
jgi:dipeptidase E